VPEIPAWLPDLPPADEATLGGARRLRGEETVRRILDAARTTFRQLSYDGARVDDIVAEAGISHGAFYLYFRNKEDLLHRLAVDCADRIRDLAVGLDQLPRPIQQAQLEEWVRRFVAVYHDDGPVIRVWMDNRDADPLMQAAASGALGPLARALGATVAESTNAAVSAEFSGLSLLSLLERLCSYLAALDQDAVAVTATRLMFGTTIDPLPA
jgi:AcrR family transcriptional regulator